MTIDAPDWQRVITTVTAAGDVPDAPDWERIVVGPSGTPVGGGSTASAYSVYFALGYLGMTCPPANVNASGAPGNGSIRFQAFTANKTATIGHIYIWVQTPEAATANENFLCIYDFGATTANTYTLLGQTAAGACDTPFDTAGTAGVALASPVSVTAGTIYVIAILTNGTSRPSFSRALGIDLHVVNPFNTAAPVSANSTATFATPPSSVAWSAVTCQSDSYLAFCGP